MRVQHAQKKSQVGLSQWVTQEPIKAMVFLLVVPFKGETLLVRGIVGPAVEVGVIDTAVNPVVHSVAYLALYVFWQAIEHGCSVQPWICIRPQEHDSSSLGRPQALNGHYVVAHLDTCNGLAKT